MEPRESAAGQKGVPEGREKAPLQRRWVSEPSSAGSKRSTFADPDAKRHSHRESLPCGATGGLAQKYGGGGCGKLLSSAMGQSAQDSQYAQHQAQHQAQGFPRGYAYQLEQPYPQQPMQERFLSGAKPQPGLEPHAWPFAGQLPSEELYPGHSRPHGGGFPRQKSPSLPSSFGQYSQSGPELPEEGYKKEQKPKKPGKYICHYCGRACAKPSVLKKHIRSHTGERPYPCVPCGFSFKTKSNLYKHRKSHAHAIKAGLVPFSELAAGRGSDPDQASSLGEAEAHSDGEQSTDTDEEVEASMLLDKGSPPPQISFELDKGPAEKGEPAYADSAEELAMMSMKVPILIVPKPGLPSTGMDCPPFSDIKGAHISSQVGRGGAGAGAGADDSPTIKQRLALRLTEKKGQSQDSSEQSLNVVSPHSKGSTDSGYFSRSESAEQQVSPPNTNAKSYEEIMFGRTWYYRPNSRSRQSVTVGMAAPGQEPGLVGPGKAGALPEGMGKISEDHVFLKGERAGGDGQLLAGVDPKQYPTGPCQSNTGLLEAPGDSGPLIRSNSMPTSSPANLSVPQGIRGSHSFDETMTSDDVFYPGAGRRLRRQAAFEHPALEGHGEPPEAYGHVPKSAPPGASAAAAALKPGERSPGVPEHPAYGPYGTKVGMTEIATRKRRKEKSVGDEEDSPGHCDSSCSGSVEMLGDYDCKQGSQDSSRATPTGKGSVYSAHSQSDSFDTCASMCSEDIVLVPDSERKAAGNVISVIQHTNSFSRPNSFEKSESFEHPAYQQDKPPHSQYSEQSDTENIEDPVQSPESLLRSESMEQQQSDGELATAANTAAVTSSPGQPYHIPHKLVRQPNIQVPEIRVTEEPDKPEREPDAPAAKEPEKHVVEEFQWPQRSETLSQLPAEKLPPKKKRLRLADLEHSSGESSFESTCTSLSRSPSQESNLSHSSSFSVSFERDDGLKSTSPTRQDELARQSEFLTVPGSNSLAIPGHHQQREMRRSSSEQAPCALPAEEPETRSKSFDYGSLSATSRQGEVYCSASAMKERRRGYLVRQASLSVYPETAVQEVGGVEVTVKQEHPEIVAPHPAWPGPPAGEAARLKRLGQSGLGPLHHPLLHHSTSEDSQQDEPHLYQRPPRLPGQGSAEREHLGHEVAAQEAMQYQSLQGGLSSLPFLPMQPGLFWHPESTQRHKQHLAFQTHQLHKQLLARQPSLPHPLQPKPHGLHPSSLQQIQEQCDAKADANSGAGAGSYPFSPRASPQHFGPLQCQVSLTTTSTLLLQQVPPVFATQNAGAQAALSCLRVPVRIQTHVPSYGTVMYTNVSQILATHCSESGSFPPGGGGGSSSKYGAAFNLAQILGQPEGATPRYPPWKVLEPPLPPGRLNTGIPLSLTSGTISTTDASSGLGSSKRMLSPASSLELFIETKQQKRVKEERMYGQIVKELGAVELSASKEARRRRPPLKSEASAEDDQERMSSSPPLPPADFPSSGAAPLSTKVPVRSSAPHLPDVPPADSFTPPLQIVTDPPAGGRREAEGRASSPEDLDVDEDGSASPEADASGGSPRSMVSSLDASPALLDSSKHAPAANEIPVNMLVQLAANQNAAAGEGTLLITDLAEVQQLFRFPSLRTTTSVSWCFLNYTKPNDGQTTPSTSVYGSWCVSSYNPNPLSLSTKASLALLRSKQRTHMETYTVAAMGQPGAVKLVSSLAWKQRIEQIKPELMQLDVSKFGKKVKSQVPRERSKEEHGEKEAPSKQAEPTRIKIFEGGYKSNEDYVYVRGRGRGKYICEECGIRCKKPSMLKKHIRTHTDVRPYVCKFCNFAFKTKGNLTKHMKSKAHMKKCLELGVSVSSVEELDAEDGDNLEECQRDSGKMAGIMSQHQFSDADDSDGGEEDGDEIDDEDEDDDEYDGDSTPKTRSRSTSPQPYALPSMSITSAAASHGGPAHPAPAELLGHTPKAAPPLFGYFAALPSIQITSLSAPGERGGGAQGQMAQYQRLLQGALGEAYGSRLDVPSSMEEDFGLLSPDHSSSSFDLSPSSRLSSPGLDSSPLREPSPASSSSCSSSRRYLSPRRDLSPRGGGRLSPRRDASPLRHVSPKRDLAFRHDLSPRRDLSPRGHLSPLSRTGRPVSPGGELAGRRELSPRGRHRGMIRPVSPRRGSHHHHHHHHGGAPWSLGQHLQADTLTPGLRGRGQAAHADTTEQRRGSHGAQNPPSPPHQAPPSPPHQGLFSHLPLHSQAQVRSPFPMIPIGGIQMVHAIPGHAHGRTDDQGESRLPLQKSTSEESSASEASCHPSEGNGVKGSRSPSRDSPQQQQERMMMTTSSSSSPASQSPAPVSTTAERAHRDGAEGRDRKQHHHHHHHQRQEESIQTCTKAIASLCIAAEEPPSADPPRHPSSSPLPPPSPLPTPQESGAPPRIQHFTGPLASLPLHPSGADAPLPATSKPSGGGPSLGLVGQTSPYSPGLEERPPGQQRPGDRPSSTKRSKELSKEAAQSR